MNRVEDRELYRRYAKNPRPATEALNRFGGIATLSPVMQRQAFQAGGPVTVGPGITAGPEDLRRGYTFDEWSRMTRGQRAARDLPVSPLGGQLAYDRFSVGFGAPEVMLGARGEKMPVDISETPTPAPRAGRPPALSGLPPLGTRAPGYGLGFGAFTRDAEAAAEPAAEPAAAAQETLDPAVTAAILQDAELTDAEKMDSVLAMSGLDIVGDDGKKMPIKSRIDEYKSLLRDSFGLDVERENRISGLNRALMGFAIAAGESPRATQNIAAGMAAGAQAMLEEETAARSREDRIAELAVQQAFQDRAAQMRMAAGGGRNEYSPERLRQRVIEAILRDPDQFNVYDEATNQVDPTKVQQQAQLLVDSMAAAGGGAAPPPPSTIPAAVRTATNPQTGEKLFFDGTQWLPIP